MQSWRICLTRKKKIKIKPCLSISFAQSKRKYILPWFHKKLLKQKGRKESRNLVKGYWKIKRIQKQEVWNIKELWITETGKANY